MLEVDVTKHTWVVDIVEHASQVLEVVHTASTEGDQEVKGRSDGERGRADGDGLLRGQLTVGVPTPDDELRRRKQEVLNDFLSWHDTVETRM